MNKAYKILLTRTSDFSSSVIEHLNQVNIHSIHLPLIEIHPIRFEQKHYDSVAQLEQYHYALFISKWAALYGVRLLQSYWRDSLPSTPLTFGAIGPTTAKMLETKLKSCNYFLSGQSILTAQHLPYDSESFLTLPEMNQRLDHKKIMIFRGNGGRELLAETLKARGATVHIVETYERKCPHFTEASFWSSDSIKSVDIIVITSAYALNNLVILSSKNNTIKEWIKNIPLIVVGERLLKLAKEKGFTKLTLANAADDKTLKTTLLKWFKIN